MTSRASKSELQLVPSPGGRAGLERATRYSTTSTPPPDLAGVVKLLSRQMPPAGYVNLVLLKGVIKRASREYRDRGPCDDMLRFLRQHGVVIDCDTVQPNCYLIDDVMGGRVVEAAKRGTALALPTTTERERRFRELATSVAKITPTGAVALVLIENKDDNAEASVSTPDTSDVPDFYTLLGYPELSDPAYLQTLNSVELDAVVGRSVRIFEEAHRFLELTARDKDRREREAEASRDLELKRRELDRQAAEVAAQLVISQGHAEQAKRAAAQAEAEARNGERRLKELKRQRALT